MTSAKNYNITPIFVLGLSRNGTTWLVNSLAKNDFIAAPSHWLHYGVKEIFFGQLQNKIGEFNSPDDYIQFLGRFSLGDVFALTEGDIHKLLYYPKRDFYEIFFDIMDSFAKKKRTSYWVMKMDNTLLLDGGFDSFWERVKERYQSPIVISIKRDNDDVMNSYINMEGQSYKIKKRFKNFTAIYAYARQQYGYKLINHITKQNKGILISYKELRNAFLDTEKKLDKYLGLKESLGGRKKDKYIKNTSFSKNKVINNKGSILWIAKKVTKSNIFSLLIVKSFRKAYKIFKKKNYEPITYRLVKYKYMRNELLKELKAQNAFNLVNAIEEKK